MSEQRERQQQEYEFVMEGITTRMQIALEKMAESNRMMSETNKRLCDTIKQHNRMIIVVVLIVVLGFIINNQVWIGHMKNIRGSGVSANETLPQLGQGAND